MQVFAENWSQLELFRISGFVISINCTSSIIKGRFSKVKICNHQKHQWTELTQINIHYSMVPLMSLLKAEAINDITVANLKVCGYDPCQIGIAKLWVEIFVMYLGIIDWGIILWTKLVLSCYRMSNRRW